MRQFFAGVVFELFTVCPGKSAVSANPLSCAAFVTGIPFEIRVRAIRSRLFTI